MADNMNDDIDNQVDDLDFSDLDLGDESFESGDFDDGDTNSEVTSEKKDYTSYIVYGLTGLVVLGIAAWQLDLFGSSTPEPFRADDVPMNDQMNNQSADLLPGSNDPFNVLGTPDQLPTQQTAQDDSNNPLIFDAMQPADSMSSDTLSDEDAMAMANEQSADFIPAQNNPTPTLEGDTLPMPQQPDVLLTDTATPTPAEAMVDAPDTNNETAFVAEPTIETEKPLPTATPSKTASIGNSDVNAIMTTLDAITKRLDTIETRLENTDNTPAPSKDINDLQKAMVALESKLKTVEKKAEDKPKVTNAPAQTTVSKKASVKKASVKKKSTSKWDQPYDGGAILDKTTSVASATTTSSGLYSLRAAQPGKGYIDDGSGAILEVRVGTIIPNMGQVTSISDNNGQWMVMTTQGAIK